MGSLLFMGGFAVLQGPWNRTFFAASRNHLLMDPPPVDLKHIMSKERLPFSVAYFGSLGLTLYFALGVRTATSSILFTALKPSNLRCHSSNQQSAH